MGRRNLRATARKALVATFAILLISSVATTGAVAAVTDTSGATGQAVTDAAVTATADSVADDGENETADEIYRYANGSAVLAYESQSDDENISSANVGLDVSTSLVDALVVSEYEQMDEDVEGDLGLFLRPDQLTGEGNLTVAQPEDVENLDASFSGTRTETESSFDASLSTLVDNSDSGMQVASASTSGDVVVGADSFELNADYSTDFDSDSDTQQDIALSIQESNTGFTVDADVVRPIAEFQQDNWDTRSNARASLQAQYQIIAQQYDGTVEVTIDSYQYTDTSSDEPDEVDIEYTVELTGIEEGIAADIVDQLESSDSISLSATERANLEQSIVDIEYEEIAFSADQDGGDASGSVTFALSNYQDPTLNYLDVLAQSDEAMINQSQVDDLRDRFEARNAANLEQTTSWSANVESYNNGTASTSVDVQYDSQNWEAYVSELQNRDRWAAGNVTFSGSATNDGEEIDAEMTFDVERENLLDSAVSEFSDSLNESEVENDSEALDAFSELDDAQLQIAKADLVFGDGSVEVRAAAQFDDLSELESLGDQFVGDATITHIYGETSNDGATSTTYVYVDDLDASDAELRNSDYADADTDIYGPGEWSRDFPRMDTQEVANFLGVELSGDPEPEPPTETNLVDYTVSATDVNVSEEVTVNATVENTGTSQASTDVTLYVDGSAAATESVTVAAGGTANATFTTSFDTAGDHTVTVGDLPETTISVTSTSSGDLVDQYDQDDDGGIDDSELQTGVQDWATGSLSDQEFQQLIRAWATS